MLAGLAVGWVLSALGAPDVIRAMPGLVGIGGGLVLSFVVLLRLYRRVPADIRGWVTPDGPEPRPPVVADVDFDAERATLDDRIRAADAARRLDDSQV